MAAPMEVLKTHLSGIRVPAGGQMVYKDECAYSFDSPESETGLFICVKTFLGFGVKHVMKHFNKTGNAVYLHLKRIRVEIKNAEEEPLKKKPTKLAIGVEGGFDTNEKRYGFEEFNKILLLPEWLEIPLPSTDLPDVVQQSIAGILAADSAAHAQELAAMTGTWDGEKRVVSKHAETLVQLDNGVKVPPSGWKCERCDLTHNVWLNLTSGAILCGRKFFDGSGGNDHAVDYYRETKYPLAVKLGTITPDGADVYSYDEDDMVLDPHLAKHLTHFGINVAALQKTEKTMTELEIDLNQRIGEWDLIQESGTTLTPLSGPGYTGIVNLGNSCYINSVMQVLFNIQEFQSKYIQPAESIFNNAPSDVTNNFNVQMAKFGCGLLSGEYSPQVSEDSKVGIRPEMFKYLVGRGHPEFSTKRQQDVQEFILHLFSLIERNCRNATNPTDCLKFEVEERIQCVQSSRVRYTHRNEYILSLPIPLDRATNKDEVAQYEAKQQELEARGERIDPKHFVRPRVPLLACLGRFSDTETIEDFYSTAVKATSVAAKFTRLSSFPDYLLIQLRKFTISSDWTPKKLDVAVDVPDQLDLSALRGTGLKPTEEELPSSDDIEVQVPQIDEGLVQQLCQMGFAVEGCRKAVYHTQGNGLDAALEWVFQHSADADFCEPLQLLSNSKKSDEFQVSEDGLGMIMSMGFSRQHACKALKATQNNVERAADWIFSHSAELDAPDEQPTQEPQQAKLRDGSEKYRLVAFISHMGTSTSVGHYVCHILKDGRWVIYNDEKVALSEKPPKELAYLYLYQRAA